MIVVSNSPKIEDSEITVGTRCTEICWSDRYVWEIIYKIDKKTLVARKMNAKNVGGQYSQDWELSSNPTGQIITLRRYKDGWYEKNYWGKKETNKFIMGTEDYYYDWSF